jgi:hypothetical protein
MANMKQKINRNQKTKNKKKNYSSEGGGTIGRKITIKGVEHPEN